MGGAVGFGGTVFVGVVCAVGRGGGVVCVAGAALCGGDGSARACCDFERDVESFADFSLCHFDFLDFLDGFS